MKLKCERGPLEGQEFELEEQVGRAILGREPAGEGLFVELPSPTVSKVHAEIFYDKGVWKIRDLRSFNGIRVNRAKTKSATLRNGDVLDLGEFRFRVQPSHLTPGAQVLEPTTPRLEEGLPPIDEIATKFAEFEAQSSLKISKLRLVFEKLRERYEKVDFKYRLFGLLALGGMIVHFLAFQPLESEAKRRFLEEATANARLLTANLGERSKLALAQGDFSLECDGYARSQGVLQAYVLNTEGRVLCPIGVNVPQDDLMQKALRTQEIADTCARRLQGGADDTCEVIYPVKVVREGQSVPELIGFTRILYEPSAFNRAVSKFSQVQIQTLVIVLISLGLIAFMILGWLKDGLRTLTDEVHLLFTGTAQNVERLQSFASFNDLVDEVNRLNSKQNQSLTSSSAGGAGEAGFLQDLINQVFLLEERAVMAVDIDNHVIALSAYVPEIIPLSHEYVNLHVSEAIVDSHLQAEMVGFLNDLNGVSAGGSIDKALSMSDRIIQVRGMPLYHQGRHIASLVFVYPA